MSSFSEFIDPSGPSDLKRKPRTKKELYAFLRSQIDDADKIKQDKLDQVWKRTLKNYRGTYATSVAVDTHVVTVDTVKAIVNLMTPAIYFRDPHVRCLPRVEGTAMQCKLHERLLNYYIRELKFKRTVKRVIKDALLFGVGYIKWGYTVERERELDPVFNEEENRPLLDNEGNPLLRDQTGNVFLEKQGLVEPFMTADGRKVPPSDRKPSLLENIKYEAPFAERWSPWDVLVDPVAQRTDLSDARWLAFRYYAPLDEIKGNSNFKNTTNLQPTAQPEHVRELRHRDHQVTDTYMSDLVTLYEIWYKEWDNKLSSWRMKMYLIAEGSEKFLVDDFSPYQIDNFPVAVLAFEEDPESQHSMSPIESVRPQIQVINMARTQYTNHRERFNQKYLYNKRAGINERDARRIAKGRYGEYIGLDLENPDSDVRTAVRPIEVPAMDQSVYNDPELAWQDIRRVMGIPEHYMGGADVARQATQATFIENALNVRLNEKQDIVSDTIEDVMRGWTQVLKQYADFEKVVKITQFGQDVFQQFNVTDNIPDDLTFYIDMFPSMFQDKEKERQDIMLLLNIIANFPEINRMALLKDLIESFSRDPAELLKSPEQVQQEQQQALMAQQGGALDQGIGSAAEGAVDTNSANRALNVDQANQGQALG